MDIDDDDGDDGDRRRRSYDCYDAVPPTAANRYAATGFVAFAARLSPSFALFTLVVQRRRDDDDEDGTCGSSSLDVVVSRRRKGRRRKEAHEYHVRHVADIMDEVELCQSQRRPIAVLGWTPLEPCTKCCTGVGGGYAYGGNSGNGTDDDSVTGCGRSILHCWNVNDVPVPPELLQHKTTKGTAEGVNGDNEGKDDGDGAPLNGGWRQQKQQPVLLCQEISTTNTPAIVPQADKKKRVSPKNRHRAARFVDFLIDALGYGYLKYPQQQHEAVGVLDVAGGGSGGVTFELSLRRGIASSVVDPRPVKLTKEQRNTLKWRRKCRDALRPGLESSHCTKVLHERFEDWQPRQFQTLFDEDFAATEEGDRMLRNCTAVIGMHPDEATDAIIELAMRYRKPWAVVPCCVFPKKFPRPLPGAAADGTGKREVRVYEDLCRYIRTTISDDVREATLDFEGRNKVYYWIPPEAEGGE